MGTHCSRNLSKAEYILFSLCLKLGSSNMFWEEKKNQQNKQQNPKNCTWVVTVVTAEV